MRLVCSVLPDLQCGSYEYKHLQCEKGNNVGIANPEERKPNNSKYPFVWIYDDYIQKEPTTWENLLEFLQSNEGKCFKVYIPVTEDSFGDLQRFNRKIPALVEDGYVYGYAQLVGETVEVKYCIEDGGRGDEDGYGVEPDEWIVGKMNLNGTFIERFYWTE